ncbi:MAG TPA: alpha/beta fold hydrolase BchO [Saliniramus sp.]|nr:alpha/beta fold hydrolase BchO [Saliniramus sp.]
MGARLVFERDGRDWPNRAASHFIEAGGMRWHVQRMGAGPVLLLVHGTAATTHSWRAFMPELAQSFDVVAFDLPGHGFTDQLDGPATLPAMARAVGALVEKLDIAPDLAVGHSAGAAILLRMALDGRLSPRGIVGLNAALLPFRGAAAHIFSPLAKLLVLNPLVPRLFAWRASDGAATERLIRGTGSTIDEEGLALYARVIGSPAHVKGALAMMARWDLAPLLSDMRRLGIPLHLIVGEKDRAVAPEEARRVRESAPGVSVEHMPGVGHLAHEERPREVAQRVLAFAERVAGDES